jgi:cyclase
MSGANLIVARMKPESADDVAALFTEFDRTDAPMEMGTRSRELLMYKGLYFHLQTFDDDRSAERIESARGTSSFLAISAALKAHIDAYDPATWSGPSDAMATSFYSWRAVR